MSSFTKKYIKIDTNLMEGTWGNKGFDKNLLLSYYKKTRPKDVKKTVIIQAINCYTIWATIKWIKNISKTIFYFSKNNYLNYGLTHS